MKYLQFPFLYVVTDFCDSATTEHSCFLVFEGDLRYVSIWRLELIA